MQYLFSLGRFTTLNSHLVKMCCQKGERSVNQRSSFRYSSPCCLFTEEFSAPLPFCCLMWMFVFKYLLGIFSVPFLVKMEHILRAENLSRSPAEEIRTYLLREVVPHQEGQKVPDCWCDGENLCNEGDSGGFDSLLITRLNPDGDCVRFITHNTRFHR